jgi:hypothetical protein
MGRSRRPRVPHTGMWRPRMRPGRPGQPGRVWLQACRCPASAKRHSGPSPGAGPTHSPAPPCWPRRRAPRRTPASVRVCVPRPSLTARPAAPLQDRDAWAAIFAEQLGRATRHGWQGAPDLVWQVCARHRRPARAPPLHLEGQRARGRRKPARAARPSWAAR